MRQWTNIIGSDNGFSPGCCQAIIWNNVGISLIGNLGTNFSETISEIHTFSFKKMHLKMSSAKWWQFCPGPNGLNKCMQYFPNDSNCYPLFRVRSWNNGMRCVSFYILIKRRCTLRYFRSSVCLVPELHYKYVIILARWRLNSPAPRLFTRPFVYSGTDERKHQSSVSLAFVREFTGDRWIPGTQRGSNAENVSIWWRHHELCYYALRRLLNSKRIAALCSITISACLRF